MSDYKKEMWKRCLAKYKREKKCYKIIEEKSKKDKEEKTEDTKNREKILQILVNYIANGATEEEAINNVMKNPIVENLKYLDNLSEVFRDWINRDYTKKMILARKREIQNQSPKNKENTENAEIDDEGER